MEMYRPVAREEYAEKLQAAYGKAVEQARVEINKMIDGSLYVYILCVRRAWVEPSLVYL